MNIYTHQPITLYRGDTRRKGEKFDASDVDYIFDGKEKNTAGWHFLTSSKEVAIRYATEQMSRFRKVGDCPTLTTVEVRDIKVLDVTGISTHEESYKWSVWFFDNIPGVISQTNRVSVAISKRLPKAVLKKVLALKAWQFSEQKKLKINQYCTEEELAFYKNNFHSEDVFLQFSLGNGQELTDKLPGVLMMNWLRANRIDAIKHDGDQKGEVEFAFAGTDKFASIKKEELNCKVKSISK